ncbi:sister chromatid cohesion protein pds5-like isoform X2 [Eucalyptus grandis]|nr:sister chromatid cohesion protein pds5-like isoform X2 [Eucalyptus grandis]
MEQGASEPLLDSFLPVMKALISYSLLKHSVEGIRVFVTCCLTELLRISVPQEMFNDDQMKVIFELIVEAILKLSQASGQYYEKALSILETVAQVKACLLMLDLKCDALVVQMFQTFWEIIRFYDGLIQSYDPLMKKHKVLYDDGDKETLNLEKERWDFIEDDLPVEHRHVADNPKPITSPVILRKQNGNKAEWE